MRNLPVHPVQCSTCYLIIFVSGRAVKEKGHNALAEFILNIDRWFDCMNAGK